MVAGLDVIRIITQATGTTCTIREKRSMVLPTCPTPTRGMSAKGLFATVENRPFGTLGCLVAVC
jgi:hypothetical protein